MRVGAVDLGTHTTRLLVADVADGRIDEVERDLRFTKLGEGVDERRRLLPLPIARVRNTLSDYRRELEALGAERTLAVGTSAVRDAENGEAFLGEVEWSYGFATRLLTGEEEALLTFRGVAAGRDVANETLVIDVGGVRLTERFLAGDPPAREQLAGAASYVRALLEERVPEAVQPRAAIAVAGTATTLATLRLGLDEEDPELVHGHRLTSAWIGEQLQRLGGMTVEEIRALR